MPLLIKTIISLLVPFPSLSPLAWRGQIKSCFFPVLMVQETRRRRRRRRRTATPTSRCSNEIITSFAAPFFVCTTTMSETACSQSNNTTLVPMYYRYEYFHVLQTWALSSERERKLWICYYIALFSDCSQIIRQKSPLNKVFGTKKRDFSESLRKKHHFLGSCSHANDVCALLGKKIFGLLPSSSTTF